MLRLRIVVPLLLSSLVSAPAFGELNTSHCIASPTSPRCEAERAREFAKARNAEIEASVAAVNAARAREFANARSAEIDASIAAVNAARGREFAKARNAEINASIAAVGAERFRRLARTHCKTPDSTTPRCMAERAREFAKARNAEINASIATVAAVRDFELARNREINSSIAAVEQERARLFAAVRNAEINASIAAVEQERARVFAAARNAEIDASIAAVEAQHALRLALAARQSRLETGAISLPDTISLTDNAPVVRRARHLGPCREAARLMSPMRFSEGNAEIEPAMKPELDRIAMMVRACPAIRIEIHGYSDNSGPMQINRHLAQRRAQAAVEYLVLSGIERRRLAAIGHADAQPLVPNTTADNRALNRRIEVTINDPAMEAAAQHVMWDLAELLDPSYVPPLARLSP